MRTHYQNLKVAENAPDEVIRAAYRALAQRYHPDRNQGNEESIRIMKILNDAYETLSDPDRRRNYDALLARARHAEQEQTVRPAPPPVAQPVGTSPARRTFWGMASDIIFWNFHVTVAVLIFGVLGIISLFEKEPPKKPYSQVPPTYEYAPKVETVVPVRQLYVRPATGPSGHPWPSYAAYIEGSPVLASAGLSAVTIDNTQNSSDVHLKLVSLDGAEGFPVRECFIPARSKFKFQSVTAGRYDVRYRDLSTGDLSKTEEFILTESRTDRGTEFSDLRLTLYKVANGNMQIASIEESEF